MKTFCFLLLCSFAICLSANIVEGKKLFIFSKFILSLTNPVTESDFMINYACHKNGDDGNKKS